MHMSYIPNQWRLGFSGIFHRSVPASFITQSKSRHSRSDLRALVGQSAQNSTHLFLCNFPTFRTALTGVDFPLFHSSSVAPAPPKLSLHSLTVLCQFPFRSDELPRLRFAVWFVPLRLRTEPSSLVLETHQIKQTRNIQPSFQCKFLMSHVSSHIGVDGGRRRR